MNFKEFCAEAKRIEAERNPQGAQDRKDAQRWRKFCSLDADVYINTHGWSFVGKGFGEQLARHLDLMESNQGEVK